MRTRTTPIVALAATAALLLGGSAARAIPSAPGAGPRRAATPPAPANADARSHRVSFGPVGKGFPNPKLPVKQSISSSNDAFGRLNNTSFATYGTGTVLHSDPELSDSGVEATVDLATADAVYSADELSAFADELGRPIVSGLRANSGQAQARAVKIDPPDVLPGDIDMGEPAEAKAPPTGKPVVRGSETDLEPVVKADTLRAEAAARAVSTGCVIGDDLARAEASADDSDVADTDFDPEKTNPLLSLSADDPGRAVSTSKSRTYLVPIAGQPGRFGAVAEIRQTIAPVTFGIPGSDEKFTIEVAGEWVMRASSDGSKGAVSLGPENSEDYDRPVLRLFQGEDLVAVGLDDLGDRAGIFIDGEPVGDIRVGGESRAILGRPDSKPTQTSTRVSAASDVVVVRLFEPHAEMRIGHMEVGLAVPVGGVQCPGIKLTKTSDPASVRPGDTFSWNIAVSNPNDCLLDQVKVTDTPAATPGVDWKAVTSVPRANRASDGSLVFENIGALATGETRPLKLNAQVEPESALGSITNRATATGVCGEAPVAGTAETKTGIGMVLVPAVPGPSPGIATSDRPAPRHSAAAGEESASAPATSSASLTRSASATRPASATRSAAATGAPKVSGQTDRARTGAAPLPRSGADTLPYVHLALGLLGVGSVLRRVKARRRG